MRNDIYQLKSALCKKVFSYSKAGSAPVWLARKNYKPKESHNMQYKRMSVCCSQIIK